ncbi:acyltransferase [Flavobacterium phycosphaerae]|uniref:acyltransferase n=1 Tax=Flavobacterium phycosphaerae TaxID=2697515 RepID=UPI00138A12F4|nr:acyltransferase [Flavobacterium phycosphaerae]
MVAKFKNILFVQFRIWKYQWLSTCKRVTGKPILHQPLLLVGEGKINFGKNVQIGVINSPNFYTHYFYLEARGKDSAISIGDNVSINNGFSAVAFTEIIIEKNALLGYNCAIVDNDGHHLAIDERVTGTPKSAAVCIAENVFLGDNVTILKGVTIGKNSVIGNGSIVTKDIPENVVAVGNPAQVIRNL